MPLNSFGSCAKAYAKRIPSDIDILIFDEFGFAEALDNALDRAYHSGPFLTAPVIAERRSKVALDAAAEIITTQTTYWERRNCLELVRNQQFSFSGKSQTGHEAFTKKEEDSIRDVLLTANCTVTRSWAELLRLSQLLDYRPIRSRRAVAEAARTVPNFRPRSGAGTIIVWAPELDAVRASIFAIALEELKAPVVIACSDRTQAVHFGLRALYIDAQDPSQIEPFLNEAAAIIDSASDDPCTAIDLSSLGIPIAASFSCGIYEYVDGIYLYDTWDYRSILHAALSALGGEPPEIRGSIPRPQDLIDHPPCLYPPTLANPPLVSVILATRNRAGILARSIQSIARQTYPNVEVVIVNDGGSPIDHIVADLPRVTIINNELSQGATQSANQGLHAAVGKYVVFTADDDYFFPTHLSRLIYALERTGAAVAAGMCSESVLSIGEDFFYDFIGLCIRLYRATDPTALRTIPTSMALPATAARRDAALAIGDMHAYLPVYNDYEWHLRFLESFDFIWISHLVANMDVRLDRSNQSGKFTPEEHVADLSGVWSTYAISDRPDIDTAREAYIDLFRRKAPPTDHPLYRGITRLNAPKRSVYRLQ